MTANLNKAQLIGFLGEDPKSADMQRGGSVVTLSVGTTEYWKEQGSGERKSATEWHRVVIFNEPLGKTAMSYLRKGSAVYVEGTIRSRLNKPLLWSAHNHITTVTLELNFLHGIPL